MDIVISAWAFNLEQFDISMDMCSVFDTQVIQAIDNSTETFK